MAGLRVPNSLAKSSISCAAQSDPRGDFVQRVSRKFLFEKFEDRGDFGALAICELHLEGAGQGWIGAVSRMVFCSDPMEPGVGVARCCLVSQK